MKQITNRFELILPSQIEYQYGQEVTLVYGETPTALMADEFPSFSQKPKSSSDGMYYKLSFSAVVPSRFPAVAEFDRRRAVVAMILNDGSKIYIGSKSDAPLITVTAYENTFKVECELSVSERLDFSSPTDQKAYRGIVMKKFRNPALTQSGGTVSWSVANPIGKDIVVQVYHIDGTQVMVNVVKDASSVTASWNSEANVEAGQFEMLLVGELWE